jgi:peptidoglycan-associated lipoprotein
MKNVIRVIAASLLVASMAACTKKQEVKPSEEAPPPPVTETAPVQESGQYTRDSLDTDSCLRQRVIYFDFDRSDIQSQYQAQISCHAAYLSQFPDAQVRLEGSADERGSREYNLGLGERRGNAVQSALSAAGASSSQLEVVSYGEERPVCREHDESCWSKNRRVEIVYSAN